MAVTIFPQRWYAKPPIGAQLSRGHPLARGMVGCWLLNEGGGKLSANLARPISASLTTNAVWSPGLEGVGIKTPGGTGEGVDAGQLGFLSTFSLAAKAMQTGNDVAAGNYQSILSRGSVFESNSNYAFGWTGTTSFFFYARSGATLRGTEVNGGSISGKVVSLAGTWTSGAQAGYLNGRKILTSASLNGADGSQITRIGYPSSYAVNTQDRAWVGVIYHAYVYERLLTSDEALWLHHEPYSMLCPPENRTFFSVAAAAGGFQPAWAKGSNRLISGGVWGG